MKIKNENRKPKILNSKFAIFIVLCLLFLGLFSIPIQAQVGSNDCASATYIPPACPNDYVPDLNCQLKRISDPKATCCMNKCNNAPNVSPTVSPNDPAIQPIVNFEVFKTSFRLVPSSIPSIINIFFTTFLAIASVYALARGLYIAAIKRPNADKPEDLVKINKELVSISVGFAMAWGFILIVQLVANLLGVGQLNNLTFSSSSTSTGTVIIIK